MNITWITTENNARGRSRAGNVYKIFLQDETFMVDINDEPTVEMFDSLEAAQDWCASHASSEVSAIESLVA